MLKQSSLFLILILTTPAWGGLSELDNKDAKPAAAPVERVAQMTAPEIRAYRQLLKEMLQPISPDEKKDNKALKVLS